MPRTIRSRFAVLLVVPALALAAVPSATASNADRVGPVVTARLAMPAPGGVAFDAATARLVASSGTDGVLRVVDARTFTQVATVATGVPGQSFLQLFPEQRRAYVFSKEPIISVADLDSNTLVTNIPLTPGDRNAFGSVMFEADVPVILVTFGAGETPGAVALVSTVTNFRRFTVGLPFETAGIAIPNDRLYLVLADPAGGKVMFLDTFFEPFAEVSVGGNPSSLVVSPDGSRIYVSNASRGVIDVLNADTQTLMNSINVAPGVTKLALAPGGASLAALIPATGEIAHVDLTTGRLVSRARVASAPTGLTFGTDSRVVYVSDQGSNALLSIDLNYRVPGSPTAVQVKPAGSAATVSWKAPAAQGTAPIVRYQVTSIPKAGSCVTAKRSCSIKGLKPGRTYRFEVVAQTAHAQSEPARTRAVRISAR